MIASPLPSFSLRRPLTRLAVVAAAAVLTLGAGALGRPAAAHAGTNGQQSQVCASVLTTFGEAVILGPNQNGLSTASPAVRVLWTEPKFGPRCNPLAGWWWKGTVTIYWYHADGSYYRSSTCRIPTSQ